MLLLNSQPIKWFKFSGGEIQVNVECDSERAILTWKPSKAADITLLLLTVDALQQRGCRDIILDVLYLPYARQDRVCTPGQSFALQVMTDLLDNLNLASIRFWDVHNPDLTVSMFEKTSIHETEIRDIFLHYRILDNLDLSNLILCAPDKGARQKVDVIVSDLDLSPAIHFEKKRDPDTGKISGIRPNQYNRDFDGFDIMVIDDICDGGATFIEVANKLRERTSEKLYLYVTHGIFSKGIEVLLEYYSHIYCHHVLHDDKYQSHDRLTILREFPHVP